MVSHCIALFLQLVCKYFLGKLNFQARIRFRDIALVINNQMHKSSSISKVSLSSFEDFFVHHEFIKVSAYHKN